MTKEAREYPDYRWRRRWRLGNWYVAQLLFFSAATLAGGSVMYAYEKLPENVFAGTLVFPIFIIVWAGGFAALNSLQIWMDRNLEPRDGVPWSDGEAIDSYVGMGDATRSSFARANMPIRFYFYEDGFGYVGGGALRRCFVRWKDVTDVSTGFFSGGISYVRNGMAHRIRMGNTKPFEERMRKARESGKRQRR